MDLAVTVDLKKEKSVEYEFFNSGQVFVKQMSEKEENIK